MALEYDSCRVRSLGEPYPFTAEGANCNRTGTLHGVGYFPTQMASIVSLMSLSISLGGTQAAAIMLNVFNNSISKSGFYFSSTSSSSLDAISALSATEQAQFREQSKTSIALSFYAISAFMWLGVLAVCGLGNLENPGFILRSGSENRSAATIPRGI